MEYSEIVERLDINASGDLEAARVLDRLLSSRVTNWHALERLTGHNVLVCGAGPSLKEDLRSIKRTKLPRFLKMIVADGATTALLEEDIVPDVVVTDLDGDVAAIVKADRSGAIIVVHAHGDNIPRLRKIVPQLKNILGTTPTPSFGTLRNFGGFTDGDRGVYLAKELVAELIILAGMDFGTIIGEYSGQHGKNKIKKLAIGKKLIEELATTTTILNLTSCGEYLSNCPRISPADLKILLEAK